MPHRKNREAIYRDRIQKSLQFIWDHLERSIQLDEVAQASHFSPYHFHRIFHGLMGETVNNYIGRLRLEKAVNQLLFKPETSITDIALATGFSSSANFAKAFKAYFGATPSQIRNPEVTKNSKIGKIKSKYGKDFDPIALYHFPMNGNNLEQAHQSSLDVRVIAMEEKIVCGLSSLGYELQSIHETWDKLTQWAKIAGLALDAKDRFAICHDNPLITPLDKCRYDALLVLPTEVETKYPFWTSLIPQGRYAVLRYKGSPKDTAVSYMRFYMEWLLPSGFEPDDYPLMEHYLHVWKQENYVELEAYIKLKPLT